MKKPNRFTFKRLRSQIPTYETTLIMLGGRKVGTIRRRGRYYEAFIGADRVYEGGERGLYNGEQAARDSLNANFAELVEKYALDGRAVNE